EVEGDGVAGEVADAEAVPVASVEAEALVLEGSQSEPVEDAFRSGAESGPGGADDFAGPGQGALLGQPVEELLLEVADAGVAGVEEEGGGLSIGKDGGDGRNALAPVLDGQGRTPLGAGFGGGVEELDLSAGALDPEDLPPEKVHADDAGDVAPGGVVDGVADG